MVKTDVGAVKTDVGIAKTEVSAAHAELDEFLHRIATPALVLLWTLAALVIVFPVRLLLPLTRRAHA